MTPPKTVQCVGCRLFSLQKHAGMAEQGFGKCALDVEHPGKFQSATFCRFCPDFAEALSPVVEKRVVWLRERRHELEEICARWK